MFRSSERAPESLSAIPSSFTPDIEGQAELRIRYETAGFLIASFGNVSIVVWATGAVMPLVDELVKVSARFSEEWPQGTSAVHVIMNNAPLPTPEARTALAALAAEYADKLAGVGTLLRGSGFWASAMRGLLTSLQVFSRRTHYKTRTCATVHEVARWVAGPHHVERTGVLIDPARLEAVLIELLSRPTVAQR